MNQALKHPDDAQLSSVLSGQDESIDHTTLQHIESCQHCRGRLDDLSGSGEFDQEARAMLEGHFPEASSTNGDVDATEVHEALRPPSHPEMLGRLGRYEIESVVGRGGMGVVLKGFDTELNRPVALKVLARHLSYSGLARQRFAREAKAAAAVVHEHVVAIHNVEIEGDTPFLVMPFVSGESLQSRVERTGPLGVKEMLRIGVHAAAGLQAAHDQGVIHRDIKPGNILLEGVVERALVTDFGLAQIADEVSLTHTGIVTGTPNYMSPEQALGNPTDPRSDLFSLGCVLYFMATGRPPFRAEKAMGVLNRVCHEPHTPVWQSNLDIPDTLSDLIDRLLEKDPSRRFESAGKVRDELQRILVDQQSPNARPWSSVKRYFRRYRKTLGVVAIVSAVGLFAIGATLLVKQIQQNAKDDAAATTNANQPLAPSLVPQEKQFSLTTWQQASPSEALQWNGEMQSLQDDLRAIEQDPWDAFQIPGSEIQ